MLLSILFINSSVIKAQDKCGIHMNAKEYSAAYPNEFNAMMKKSLVRNDEILTIPVVVHVVYRKDSNAQNISDELIYRQIEELNRAYSGNSPFIYNLPYDFDSLSAGDTRIRFVLAKTDPDGKPTNGITRTETCHGPFIGTTCGDDVKISANGGIDGWDATKYLNMWVCDLKPGLFGFGNFPATCSTNNYNGVVIDYVEVGVVKPAFNLNNLSGMNTTIHEVGHYLGLFHTWGDEPLCADDDTLSDTPSQATETSVYPGLIASNYHPLKDICSPAIMFMDIMDYNNDPACFLITKKQKQVIRNVLTNVSLRGALVDPANPALSASIFNTSNVFKVWNTGFPSNAFRCIISGKDGEIWAGAANNGIWRYNDIAGIWETEPTTTTQIVRDMVKNSEDDVFIASGRLTNTIAGGVRQFETADDFTYTKYGSVEDPTGSSELPSRLVNGLCLDDDDDVWVACGQHVSSATGDIFEGGIAYISNGIAVGYYAGSTGLPPEDVRCLAIESVITGPADTDDQIWVSIDGASTSSGAQPPRIAKFNTTLGVISYLGDVNLPGINFAGGSRIRSIRCTKNGVVYLGINTGQNGIGVFGNNTCNNSFKFYESSNSKFPVGAIVNQHSIEEDADGNIWVATSAGLIKIDGGNVSDSTAWSIYTTADGLPDNNITGITFDAGNNLWCSTSNGIFRNLPCEKVIIKSVTNANCSGIGHIETEFKGGNFQNPYQWYKMDSTGTYVPYLTNTSIDVNTPGKYKLQVKNFISNAICYDRVVDVVPADLRVPTIITSNPTACGFDVKLANISNTFTKYSVDAINGTDTSNLIINGTGAGTFTVLDTNKIYKINVSATCTEEPTQSSVTLYSVSRDTTVRCSSVKNITATNITAYGATINWESQCSDPFRYRFKYKKHTDTLYLNISFPVNPTKTITNLEPNTKYDVFIVAQCSNDGSMVSVAVVDTFTTADGCGKPDGFSVNNITTNSAKLHWTLGQNALDTRVRYRKVGSATWLNKVVVAPNDFANLTSLQINSTYQYQTRTKCTSGFSPYSSINTFSTLPLRLDEYAIVSALSVYPNPNTGKFDITVTSLQDETVKIIIVNVLGQVVKSIDWNLTEGDNAISINEYLSNGIYQVQILNDKINIQESIVVQK